MVHMRVPGSKPVIYFTVTEQYRTMCGGTVPGAAIVDRWDLVDCGDCMAAGVEQALRAPKLTPLERAEAALAQVREVAEKLGIASATTLQQTVRAQAALFASEDDDDG